MPDLADLYPGFASHWIDTSAGKIFARAGGAGPPLMLIHGYAQTNVMWHKVAAELAKHFALVIPDLPGYGWSAVPDAAPDHAPYTKRAMAAAMVEVMEALGHVRFALAGHDRGGRVSYRLALDHPGRLEKLATLDIVPTYAMFMDTNRKVAGAYWHWYFLSQPAPFPERMIGADPDFFYETCLVGWGAAKLADFDAETLADYRRCWRDPAMIHGSCSDYRAAATIDLEHDGADIDRKLACPTLVFYGAAGQMAKLFDIPAEWRKRCVAIEQASLPGGHFFVDQFPDKTAEVVAAFLRSHQ